MAEQLRFAIVGCGLVGTKRLKALPPNSVVATCDIVGQRADALASRAGPQCTGFTDLNAALEQEPDAVIVATLNSSLAPVAAHCIRAGKHVLIEKPVATSVAELDVLYELAERNAAVVRAGYNHRFHPAILKARQLIDAGSLGEMMFIRGRYGHGGRLGYDREWRANSLLSGGGELMDQGVHLIDLASWIMGSSWATIDGHTATYYWDMPVDDNAFISLRTPEGKTAWLQVSCTEWKNLFSLEIYGTAAKLHIEGLGGSYGIERLHEYHMLSEMGPPETLVSEYPTEDDSWTLETAEFIKDIQLGRRPAPGLAEARATLLVVEAIYNKSRTLTGVSAETT